MEFLHPEFLYFMLPPLFILFALLLTQKESSATFFSQEIMEKLRVSGGALSLKTRNLLFFSIGVLMVVALAAPVIPEGKVEVKAKSADIMMALDISDSMLAQDVYPNRLEFAKQKALELLRLAPNERMGIIAFAKNSYLVSPLSFDHSAVAFLLRKLSTESITEKGTDFLSLLEVLDKQVKKESQKYLLLLSDGGDASDFSKEIAFAKEKGISVFVLGVGTSKGAPVKLQDGEFIKENGNILISKRNENIVSLATKTGGVYIESRNSLEDVKAMLLEIEAHSEKKELKSEEIERFIPLFYFPLGAALLLLLIATSSMSKREKVGLPSAFLLAAFFGLQGELNAGLLDFMELKKAKVAYEQGEYEKSAAIYEKYAQESQKAQAYYNGANALYKQGKFEEARELYKKAHFKEPSQRAKNFANLGNGYAKEPTIENLRSAIESYESALKIEEDSETKENLEAVKKALEQMQEQDKKDEKNEEQGQEEEKEEGNQNQEQNESSKEDADSKKEQSKESKEEKQEKEQKEQKEQKEETQESQEEKERQEKGKEEEPQTQEHNQTQEQLQELEDKEETKDETAQNAAVQEPQGMSESEEKKWLEALTKESGTYLYRLNDDNTKKENADEKPW